MLCICATATFVTQKKRPEKSRRFEFILNKIIQLFSQQLS